VREGNGEDMTQQPPDGSAPGHARPPVQGQSPGGSPAGWGPPPGAQWPPPYPPQQPYGQPAYGRQPAYAQQPYGQPPHARPPLTPARAFPHPEPTPYHQMLRTWDYATWRPVVGVVLLLVAFFVVPTVVFLVVALVASGFADQDYVSAFMDFADLTRLTPAKLLGLNLGLAALVPTTWLLMRALHHLRPRWLSSVVPRLRWKFFAVCLGLAVVALLAQLAVGAVLPGDGTGTDGGLKDFTTTSAVFAVIILLTTPLQAAGEEYVARGYLLQAFGSLFRNRWVAIVATAVLFALAHGAQNAPLFFDRFAFGFIAAWLVTATGGLEAGIALHVLNNFLAFGLALAYGDLSDALNVSEASWWNIALTVTQSAVYAALVLLVARRMGLQTRSRPPAPEPSAAPESGVATV